MAAIVDPEILKVYGFWSAVLILKLLAMGPLTARQRMRKGVFANPEDAGTHKKGRVAFDDPDVERVRRAHLNDLENILPWFVITYIWLGTGPSYWLASLLIRTFAISRIAHTVVYAIVPLPQPSRAIAFAGGMFTTAYMTVSTLWFYL